jgi:transcriptional antiterminator RfaH
MKLRMSRGGIAGTESLGVHWYALNTKANHEKLVAQQIERIGIECFLPLLEEQRVIRYPSKLVIAPLFPGYLFVRANLMEHYRVLAYTRGVRKIVTFGSSPAVVDSMIIDAIKAKMSNVRASSIQQSRETESGQLVRITDGPLAGLDAVFMRKMSGGQRAMLLLRTLVIQSRAIINIDQIALCVAV